jgi:hypothetical protein
VKPHPERLHPLPRLHALLRLAQYPQNSRAQIIKCNGNRLNFLVASWRPLPKIRALCQGNLPN